LSDGASPKGNTVGGLESHENVGECPPDKLGEDQDASRLLGIPGPCNRSSRCGHFDIQQHITDPGEAAGTRGDAATGAATAILSDTSNKLLSDFMFHAPF
jgi:hypothetical protein